VPFGLIFGALFFGGVCGWIAVGLLGHPSGAAKLAGVFLGLLGTSLALGLLKRRPWARWGGIGCAAAAALQSLRLVSTTSGVVDHVLMLASVATAVLLAVPATGAARGAPRGTRRVGLLEAAAVVGAVGLLAVGLGADRSPPPGGTDGPATPPASLTSRRVDWTDFGAGLEQARVTGKPVLATFVTSWCPYCTKMRGDTWRSPAVTERLQETVPVRVDAEDPGQGGPELAARYRISGYPVQLLLDPEGGEVARSDGYQTPGQFLGWLDAALDRYRSVNPPTTRKVELR